MSSEKICYNCKRDENMVALLEMTYKGEKMFVCPQHLPDLIHSPAKVADLVPGSDKWEIPGEKQP